MITIEVWKGMGGLHQIAIDRGDGTGYRISGPKFNGKSKILYSHQITKRDADEIRQIVDKEFPTDHQAALDRLTRYMNEQIARKQRDIEAVERENAELRLYKNATINQESAREKRIKELEAQLDAWQTVFGTSQLTHAQSRLEQAEKAQAALSAAQGEVERLKMELEATRKELGDKTWRLRRPYEAWLSDSLKKDNCRNCKNSRPPTIAHNPDRVSCQYADGWPHWTNKCDRWEAQEAIGGKP